MKRPGPVTGQKLGQCWGCASDWANTMALHRRDVEEVRHQGKAGAERTRRPCTRVSPATRLWILGSLSSWPVCDQRCLMRSK